MVVDGSRGGTVVELLEMKGCVGYAVKESDNFSWPRNLHSLCLRVCKKQESCC